VTAESWSSRGLWRFVSALGLVLGVLGVLVARSQVLRAAIGSLITGLQTMPFISWFPLATFLFQLSEKAILFVILIGAVPSITNRPSLGQFLNQNRELSETPYMIALMIAILTIGITVDAVFSTIERGIRRRRGVVLSGGSLAASSGWSTDRCQRCAFSRNTRRRGRTADRRPGQVDRYRVWATNPQGYP
jgi:ABC-type nitrate/sulfonate/bicarbonate transport system permease component